MSSLNQQCAFKWNIFKQIWYKRFLFWCEKCFLKLRDSYYKTVFISNRFKSFRHSEFLCPTTFLSNFYFVFISIQVHWTKYLVNLHTYLKFPFSILKHFAIWICKYLFIISVGFIPFLFLSFYNEVRVIKFNFNGVDINVNKTS